MGGDQANFLLLYDRSQKARPLDFSQGLHVNNYWLKFYFFCLL